jgi:hypothetical protein
VCVSVRTRPCVRVPAAPMRIRAWMRRLDS